MDRLSIHSIRISDFHDTHICPPHRINCRNMNRPLGGKDGWRWFSPVPTLRWSSCPYGMCELHWIENHWVIFIFIYIIIFVFIYTYVYTYIYIYRGLQLLWRWGWLAPGNCRVNPRGFPFYGMGWNGWNLLFHESPVINLCGNITNITNPTLLRGMFSISRCCNTAEGMRLPASFRLWTARVLLLCPVWWLRLLVSVGHWCQLTSAVGRFTFLVKELQDWPANYQQQVRKTISFMRVLLSGSTNWRQWYVVIYLCFHYMHIYL